MRDDLGTSRLTSARRHGLLAMLVALVCAAALASAANAATAAAAEAAAQATDAETTQVETLNADQQALDNLVRELFVSSCETSYVTLHSNLTDPEAWGLDAQAIAEEAGWQESGVLTDFEGALESARELVGSLEAIDRAQLDDERTGVYDGLLFEAELNLAACDPKFDYYAQAFLTGTGFYETLPYLLLDWELRDESDARCLVTLLGDTKRYADELLDYAQAQAERGLLIVDAQAAVDACQIVVDEGTGNTVLQALLEKVGDLDLDEATIANLKAEVTDAYASSYVQAFSDAVTFFTKVRDEGLANEGGYASLEYGPEYYELCVQYATGTTMTVDEMWDFACAAMDESLEDFITTTFEDDSAYDVLEEGGVRLDFTSYEEVIEFIRSRMGSDFSDIGDIDYAISDLPDSVAAVMQDAFAYFLVPAIDDEGAVRIIRVNPLSSSLTDIATYVTIAHEGMPGHMYQLATIYRSDVLRMGFAVMSSLGSVEGYAEYVALECLDYLDELTEAQARIYRDNKIWGWAVTVLLEIGVNAYGWDVDDIGQFYVDCGVLEEGDIDDETRAEIQEELRTRVYDACSLEPYGIGLLEFEQLKASAQERLGDDFSSLGFNAAILSRGITTFASIGEAVDDWVEVTSSDEGKTATNEDDQAGENADASQEEDLDLTEPVSQGAGVFDDFFVQAG